MFIYILNVLLILLVGFFVQLIIGKEKSKKLLCILFFIQLLLISIFRDMSVGADILGYKINYEYIRIMTFPTYYYMGWESGYVLLNSIIGAFTGDFRIFMIIVSFVVLKSYSKFIYLNSKNIVMSFFLLITFGFFTHSLNLFRQSIAIALILYSVEYIKKEDIKKYSILVLIAVMFHKTAILFYPIYFLRNIKINIKKSIIILFLLPLIIIIGELAIKVLINMDVYNHYSNLIIKGEGYNMLIVYILIAILAWIFRKNMNYEYENNIINNIMYNCILIIIIMQLLATKFSLFSRATLYFSIFFIILIPNIIESIKNKKTKLFINLGIIFCFCVLYIASLIVDSASIVPYILI